MPTFIVKTFRNPTFEIECEDEDYITKEYGPLIDWIREIKPPKSL